MAEGSTEANIVHLSDERDRKLRQSDQTPHAPVVTNPPVSELSGGSEVNRSGLGRKLKSLIAIGAAAAGIAWGHDKVGQAPSESVQTSTGVMAAKNEGTLFNFRERPQTDFQKKAIEELKIIDQNDPRIKRGLIVGQEGANFRNVPLASADAQANAESIIGKLKPGTVVKVALEVSGKSLDGSKWYAADLGGNVGFFSEQTLDKASLASK